MKEEFEVCGKAGCQTFKELHLSILEVYLVIFTVMMSVFSQCDIMLCMYESHQSESESTCRL